MFLNTYFKTVKISGLSLVTSIVCSNWATSLLLWVVRFHSSSNSIARMAQVETYGSQAIAIPASSNNGLPATSRKPSDFTISKNDIPDSETSFRATSRPEMPKTSVTRDWASGQRATVCTSTLELQLKKRGSRPLRPITTTCSKCTNESPTTIPQKLQ